MRAGSKILVAVLAAALILSSCPGTARGESHEEGEKLTVYFPNWNIHADPRCQVKDLPWDRIDCVDHAFWKVVPKDGGYALESTDPEADIGSGDPKSHFTQYEEVLKKYPGRKVLLSVGGWTACGYFSEMALTKESRASFIMSCLEVLERYPFLKGLDIDWEYPNVPRAGGEGDEGNPVKGDDRANYTLFLKELREALDSRFGAGEKELTVCAGGTVSILSAQDYAALHPYVDRINLMTYDLAGPWDKVTGHQSALYGRVSADTAVKYLLKQGVPPGKIAIGSPLYSHGWKMEKAAEDPVGVPASGLPGGDKRYHELMPLERAAVPAGTPGWHRGHDEKAGAAYLWNDDPASPDYLTFYTYESFFSLDMKLRYIRDNGLGGLIVWQAHGDAMDEDWPMITRMHEGLRR
ncbi:MAG: glycoside hydrolase family 18 protein [Clostridia bacterium]|nr:glycoside hydrolase family 18 protein [Clostridia bacterium]